MAQGESKSASLNVIIIVLLISICSSPAFAYIDAVGGGLVFQLGYIIITGLLVFMSGLFSRILKFLKRIIVGKNNPQN